MPGRAPGADGLLPATADPLELRAADHERPLFFVHIPRTGGFTLKVMLENIYGTRNTLLDLHKYDHTAVEPTAYEFIEGHVGFTKARKLVGAPNVLTIVREPVSRAVSVARHLRRYGTRERHEVLRTRKSKLEHLFSELGDLSDGQTKQLSDHLPHRTAKPEDMERARFVLDTVAFGVTSEYSVSVALLAERFGLRLPKFGVSNASAERGDDDLRSDQFRELAAEHNQLDQQLYEHARTLFRDRVARYVEALRSMSLDARELAGTLTPGPGSDWDAVVVSGDATSVDLRGWMLVAGRPPDAVLADAGAGWVPLLARQVSSPAGWSTRSVGNLYAGVSGSVPIGPDATTLTIEAYDRTEGVRGSRTMPLRRS